ncbi:transmembrane channel-like protein 7 isoform X2 [Mercenaria mercenaria]|uniref:transmembrane channel-like protein 7 isoform X2 n=1 Tax=Mercenaria mercenaria TaxID=6596 RepID=UPI00234F969D|nr:transmembrane channel-like protein 7 isoform X2 [Mercenaria mercenaria]
MSSRKQNLLRKSSIPAYIVSNENAVEIDETDLRWRRSSHAAISAMLPSHNAFHSDTGLTLTRKITDPQRRKSIAQRRKSVAAITREVVSSSYTDQISRASTIRQLLMGMSTVDAWILGYEDHEQTIESIRSMTATISVKRKYRDQVLSREASKLKGWELRKYQMSMQWQRFTNWFKSWVYQLELWAGAFKVIEGHFGTSTVSYFRFLRWLMFLNLFMTLIMFSVVLLPFLLLDLGKDSSFKASVNECSSIPHNMAVFYSTNYTNDVKIKVHNSSTANQVQDVLQGTGWMENTVLFYGAYHNKTGYLATGDAFTYNMSLAYLCAVGLAFILSFILLVKNSAKGLKQSAVSSVGGNITLYCNKVFGAWDYCISESKTAQLKHSNLLQDFKNELEYQRLQWKKESRTTKEKFKLYTIRVLINILVILILGGALFLIYFTNQKLVELEKSDSLSKTVALMMQYLPSITIMLLSVIVPTLFDKLVIAEDYMPAFAIRITLIRTVLLRLASLGILMISLYTTLHPEKKDPEVLIPCDNLIVSTDNITTVSPVQLTTGSVNTTSLPTSENTTSSPALEIQDKNIMCWETYVGQQIYKLVMLNFIVVILVTLGWEFPRKFLYEKLHEKLKIVEFVGQQTFDLSKSVLDLVYLQTLCWLGVFFSPIIPAMCFVKCFIFFYVKKGSLLTNCLPTQQYGTSKSNSLFMMVLLLSFFLASIPIIFMIGRIPPSQGCGPFRVHSSQEYIMFDAVTNLVDSFAEAKEVFFFMGTGGFMAIVALCLCLLMYYFWMVGQANHNLSKSLREQLKIEGQDKQFLVARVNEAYADDFQ